MKDLSHQMSAATPMKKPKTAAKKRVRPMILDEEVYVDMDEEETERGAS